MMKNMWTVGINKDEQAGRFEIYKSFDEAREHCYPTAMVVKAVDSYYNTPLGFIVMDSAEADFRRVTK